MKGKWHTIVNKDEFERYRKEQEEATSVHQHKFTIPIKWEYKPAYMGGGDGYIVSEKRVLTLLCECGKEKSI